MNNETPNQRKLNVDDEIKKLKKEFPFMDTAQIKEGIETFNELLDLASACHEDIKRSVQNTLKIGRNIGADPVVFSSMISEMLLKEATSFAVAITKINVNACTDEKNKVLLNQLK